MQFLMVKWEFHKLTFHFFIRLFSSYTSTVILAMLFEINGEVPQSPHFPMPYASLDQILKEVYA